VNKIKGRRSIAQNVHIDVLSRMLTLVFDQGRKERRKEGRNEGRKYSTGRPTASRLVKVLPTG
jgi:hypothetical protein